MQRCAICCVIELLIFRLGAKRGNTYYANFTHVSLPTGLSRVT